MGWRVSEAPRPDRSFELSLADVLGALAERGYADSFRLADRVHCPRGCVGSPTIDDTWRFEGVSDPDDESIVLALACPTCGLRGVLTAPYGALLGGPDAAALAGLSPTAAQGQQAQGQAQGQTQGQAQRRTQVWK